MGTSLSKNYLYRLEQKLHNWPKAMEVETVRKKLLDEVDAGYIRIRVRLQNGDLLEISEYVSPTTGRLLRAGYSYHWQDQAGKLIQRWDNAPHHPHARTYPHHTHLNSESNVLASKEMTVDEVLNAIEATLK